MDTTKVQPEAIRVAAKLNVGDRIAAALLPLGQPGEIVFVEPHELRGERWVFVAYRQANGFYDATTFGADSPILLDAVAVPVAPNYGLGDESVHLIGRVQAEILTGARANGPLGCDGAHEDRSDCPDA